MEVKPIIENSWLELLKDEFSSDYFLQLKKFLIEEKKQHTIFPPGNKIFEAFNLTPVEKTKVVIIGQDPYHGVNQAHGLCFSVQPGISYPPSLVNIYKELKNDLGIELPKTGCLTNWAKQGVLLLNATLTVRAHTAGSHQGKGWERFTDSAISKLSEIRENLVFILWGRYAQSKTALIAKNKHLILKAVHPSPLSANRGGFFGTQPFSKTNEYLKKTNQSPIDWGSLN